MLVFDHALSNAKDTLEPEPAFLGQDRSLNLQKQGYTFYSLLRSLQNRSIPSGQLLALNEAKYSSNRRWTKI